MEAKDTRYADAEEVARALKDLPEEERQKFFYMIEGAKVVQPAHEQEKAKPEAS